jgi:hypothetical protein
MEGIGIGEDRLEGASAIARHIFGNDDPRAVRRAFHLAERNLIPVGREGGRLVASKKLLNAHYAKLIGGQVA